MCKGIEDHRTPALPVYLRDAREVAASAMTDVIESLKANNVAEKDIQTENFQYLSAVRLYG